MKQYARTPLQPNDHLSVADVQIDLKEVFQVLFRRKWGIFGLAISVAVLTSLIVSTLIPIYTATATLLIETDEASVVSIEEVYGLASPNEEYFQTQFEILKSRRLAEKVIDRLDLTEHPEFKPKEDGFNWRTVYPFNILYEEPQPPTDYVLKQKAINQFSSQLAIAPIGNTQLVHIAFDSSDRVMAAQAANELAKVFINDNLESKLQATLDASNWLSEQLGGLQEELQIAEQQLQTFRESEQIVGSDGGMDLANRELDMISERLVEARRERLQMESAIGQLSRIAVDDLEALQRIPVVLSHTLVAGYFESTRDAELRVSELSKRYGYKHPTMISAENELQNANAQLERQVSAVVEGIQSDFDISIANERATSEQLDVAKLEVQKLSRNEFQLRALEKDVQTKQQIYDTFFTRLSETSATGNLSSANARTVDPAVVPLSPSKPNKRLIVVFVFMLALMAGASLALLANLLDNTIKTPEDVERRLGSTLLGILPLISSAEMKSDPKASYSQFLKHNKDNFSEAVRTIRTSLMLSNLDTPPKIIGITSTVPSEGKTSVALNIAFALAHMEKVLLIDADMRRPSIGKHLEFPTNQPGISNVAAGSAEMDEAIFHYEAGNLDVIAAGLIPPNPLELLSSKRFANLLEQLRSRYDRIIIDTAPSGSVSDALALAPNTDAMIYVVKAESTPITQVTQSLRRLYESPTPIMGVVLNQVDISKKSTYYSQYYSGYYNYAGYGSENSKKA